MLIVHSQNNLNLLALSCLGLAISASLAFAETSPLPPSPPAREIESPAPVFSKVALYLPSALGSKHELVVIRSTGAIHQDDGVLYSSKIVPAPEPTQSPSLVATSYRLQKGEGTDYSMKEIGECAFPTNEVPVPGWLIRLSTRINHSIENPYNGSAFSFSPTEEEQVSTIPVVGLPEGMIIEQCSQLARKNRIVLNVCSPDDSSSYLAVVDASTGQVLGDLSPSAGENGEPIMWNNIIWVNDNCIASVRGPMKTKLCQIFNLNEQRFIFDRMIEATSGDPVVFNGEILLVDPLNLNQATLLIQVTNTTVTTPWPSEPVRLTE